MTVLRAEFEYAAKIRKKGHRKTSDVVVRETAPFDIPAFATAEAPAALRFPSVTARPRAAESMRAVMDGLFAPVLGPGQHPVFVEGYDHAADHRTETCETTVASLFRLGLPESERIVDPERLGHRVLASDRDAHHADAVRRARHGLAAIGGALFMRVPEPMYVVAMQFDHNARAKPFLFVDFDPVPGYRCAPHENRHQAYSMAHFPMDRLADAEAAAAAIAERFGFVLAGTVPGAEAALKVADGGLLRADPLLVTLDQSIRSMLRLGHETLAAAPDGFVLAWADMRESLALLERGHPDAAATAAAALRAFLDNAPVGGRGQFATQAEQRRWETRTLPLLAARVAAIDALDANPSPSPAP